MRPVVRMSHHPVGTIISFLISHPLVTGWRTQPRAHAKRRRRISGHFRAPQSWQLRCRLCSSTVDTLSERQDPAIVLWYQCVAVELLTLVNGVGRKGERQHPPAAAETAPAWVGATASRSKCATRSAQHRYNCCPSTALTATSALQAPLRIDPTSPIGRPRHVCFRIQCSSGRSIPSDYGC